MVLSAMNEISPNQSPKFVVILCGVRVSKAVHATMESAELEKDQYIQQLQESTRPALVPQVQITQLLLG